MALFGTISGNYTSFDGSGITDSSASFKTNYYKGWYAKINGQEYLITSNNATQLFFANSISALGSYEINFLGRSFLIKFESDCSNTQKIPDSLINAKYYIADVDLSNEITAYLRSLTTSNFNPLDNILNLTIMQNAYANHMLDLIYRDLMIDGSSFEAFKSLDMYRKDYNQALQTGLALLEIDYNQNGEADPAEIRQSASTVFFSR